MEKISQRVENLVNENAAAAASIRTDMRLTKNEIKCIRDDPALNIHVLSMHAQLKTVSSDTSEACNEN